MVAISGRTRLYAIVGDPIAQAKSPAIYNALLVREGRDAVLVPWQLSEADFAEGLRGLKRGGNLDGLIFTYPHKQSAFIAASNVRPRARQVGAANAMRRRPDGHWEADMFDGVGLVRALSGAGIALAGLTVWLLGAGGAGSAIAFALAEAGVARIYLTEADPERAEQLAAGVMAAHPQTGVVVGTPALTNVGLLVNATPVGLAAGDGLPVPLPDHLPGMLVVVDIVPKPETPLLALALASGCRTVTGTAMVEGQALAVLDFFAGRD